MHALKLLEIYSKLFNCLSDCKQLSALLRDIDQPFKQLCFS